MMNRLKFKRALSKVSLMMIFCTISFFSAQDMSDEGLRKWVAQFSSLNLLTVNEDASYAAVTKSYMESIDTVLVFSHNRIKAIDTLVGYNISRNFLGKNYLFAHGVGKAVFVNLKTGKRSEYNTAVNGGIIKDVKQFYILDSQRKIRVFHSDGRLLYEIDNVDKLVGDDGKILFSVKSVDGRFALMRWDGKKAVALYQTDDTVEKIEMMPSGRYLSIREIGQGASLRSLKILDLQSGRLIAPAELQNLPEKTVKVTEIRKGESFLVSAETHIPVPKTPMVELWYGTDRELRFTKNGKVKYRFWHIMTDTGTVEEFPTDRFEIFTSLNNSRYLWAFSNREVFDYVSANPKYDMFLYDIQLKKYSLIFPKSSEIFGSADGRYVVSFDRKEKIWKLFDLHSQKMADVKGSDLRNPVYSLDGKKLFFSGKTDLYSYDLKTGVLSGMEISKESEVVLMDKKVIMGFTLLETKFNTVTVDTGKPLRLQLNNTLKGTTSVLELNKNKRLVLIPETDRKIKKIAFGKGSGTKSGFTIEENFNLPDGLYSVSNNGSKKKLLYQTNTQDLMLDKMKVEVVHFNNSLGVPLKGILTYPMDYDPMKKYPMVVKVYQQQSSAASTYLTGDVAQDGISKRILVEHGYFVFQPDIVFDDRGTGISALDCVNKALDAIQNNTSIDFSKVGLTGHSMGGYETDFIATKSKRFAAFVSGASVANTVQSYFSYNRLFEVPDYARFEDGQFDMNISYAENPKLYDNNNPINFVQNVNAPILLWTGRKDTNVVPEQTEAFYVGLLRNRKPVIALHYKDQSHSLGIMTPETFDLNRRVIEWWDYFLKGRNSTGWIQKELTGN
ncbi:prolyl oligopeptidase family serine peptidase [Chryseobacterium sp.]|uniref:S9 family peptidase n=1 Tax=Chryseobacterium sp. TaxID=1871047 RepID=UPI00289CE503|nr:prolyl oligopeptidase family serine peptidase [Chryseobacterium sp.]